MIRIRNASFARDRQRILDVRFAVFVDEQGVPASIENDGRDARCRHVLAFSNETPVGTGRIDLEHGGKIGRLAVVQPMRGRGIGRALVERLHLLGDEYGLDSVWCHAQTGAEPFYARLGYEAAGRRFVEAGLEHVRMVCRLRPPSGTR